MPEEKEIVHVVPEPGMKQGVDERLAAPGTLTYAQNVRFESPGRIVKRGGVALLGSDIPDAEVGGSWVHENLACVDDRVFERDESADTWLSQGTEIGLDHAFVPLGRFTAALTESDAAAGRSATYASLAVLGTTIIVATSGPGATSPASTVTLVGMTDEGRVLWRVTPFAGENARLVLAGGTLRVLYRTSAGGIDARTVTATGTVSAASTLVTAGNVDYYDAAPLAGTTDWALAFHHSADITVRRYAGGSLSSSRVITTTAAPQQVTVAGGGATNDTIWVVWHDFTNNGVIYSPNKWDLSAAWTTNTLAIGASATALPDGQPTVIRVSATEAILGCTIRLVGSAPLNLQNYTLHTRYVTNSGSAGTTVKHHGWALASKAWPEPASSVSPRRVRFLVVAFGQAGQGKHGILELGTDTEGGAIVGVSYEREAAVRDHITDAAVYDPGTGDQRLAVVATWWARRGTGSQLAAADVFVLGARHMGSGVRYPRSALRRVHETAFGGMRYLSGGASLVEVQPAPSLSSRRFPHNGFALHPEIMGDATSGGSLTASTAYSYVATYEHLDAAGQRCRSEPSDPITITTDASNKTGRVRANVPGGTSRPTATLHLWRAVNGGAYHRVTPDSGAPQLTDANGQPVADHVTFSDTLSDLNASVREELDTISLPSVPPSGAGIATLASGRMFATDWIGRVQVSKLIVAGEPVQFVDDDVFRIFPSARPTGLAALDGTLVIFTLQSIELVPIGVGPTDGGENEYDVPAALPVEDGCINPWSVVVTSQGILYQSRRGLMLLPRGFGAPVYLADVADTLRDYPVILSAAKSCKPDGTELVHFHVSASNAPETTTRVLVLDVAFGAWSVDVIVGKIAALGTRQNRLACVFAQVDRCVSWMPEDDSVYSDEDNGALRWIELRLRLAELRPFGLAGRGRFERMVAMFEATGTGSTLDEYGLELRSTLDEGVVARPDDQPERAKWQVPDDLATSALRVGRAFYLGREFKQKTGTALALELFDTAPDADVGAEASMFTRGPVFHGLSLEIMREAGLRELPREMRR